MQILYQNNIFFPRHSDAKFLLFNKTVSGVFNILNSVSRILPLATKLAKWRNEHFLLISIVHDTNRLQLCLANVKVITSELLIFHYLLTNL